MKIVIDIEDYDREWIANGYHIPDEINGKIAEAIIDGTPLPERHGDLVDRDAINSRFYDIWKELESYSNKPSYKELLDKWGMCMDTAQPIIEGSDSE